MTRRNISVEFGDELARSVGHWDARAAELERRILRVRTDNKLDRDEWLRLPDGRLLKTDAVDHHCGHDLIGCQDMAWDVAGAIVEFALDDELARRLVEASERAAGRPLHGGLLDLYRVSYCCFRLGQARLWRLSSRAVHYETAVMPLLKDNYCCFTSQKSLVD